MRRRELLKALAAVPFAAAISGCEEKGEKDKKQSGQNIRTVEIHLEGAFALVLQKNKGNSLLAFSPKPPSGMDPHEFHRNGYRTAEGGGNPLTFKFSLEGAGREEKPPEINPGMNDFFFETERWRVGNSLVTIELPRPDKITFIGHRSQVAFQSDKERKVWMPTNHVLKYELHSGGNMACSNGTAKCDASPDFYPGVTRYFFEIGPTRTMNYAESHLHAIKFFNYILQQSFPDLAKRYSLFEPPAGYSAAYSAPRLVPAVFQYEVPAPQLRQASYITDCEFGGPSVGTHTAPTG